VCHLTRATRAGVAAGIYIKSMLGRGGYVANISYSNVLLLRVLQPIKIVMKCVAILSRTP